MESKPILRLLYASSGKAKRDECAGLNLAPLRVEVKCEPFPVPAGMDAGVDVFLVG